MAAFCCLHGLRKGLAIKQYFTADSVQNFVAAASKVDRSGKTFGSYFPRDINEN